MMGEIQPEMRVSWHAVDIYHAGLRETRALRLQAHDKEHGLPVKPGARPN